MITFEKIRWKNLLSTGNNFTEISLNERETTLIIGENGAGKSTILDALCFALFGKPFRKINKPALVNSINGKHLLVELEFRTNGKDYKIVRGIKPNRFEIYQNGLMLNQSSTVKDYQEHLEKFVIKMNHKSFTSIVILGSASFTPFMQLTAADRRTVIEDLLDIQVFSTMNVLVRQRLQENKEQSSTNRVQFEATKDKIKYLQDALKASEKDKNNEAEEIKKRLSDIEHNYSLRTGEQRMLEKAFEMLADETETKNKINKFNAKSKQFHALQGKISNNKDRLEREIKFYEDNDVCPSCKQNIDEDHKCKIIQEKQSLMYECMEGLDKLDDEIEKVEKKLKACNHELDDTRELRNQILGLENELKVLHSRHIELSAQLEKLVTGDTLMVDQSNYKYLEEAKKTKKKLENQSHELADQRAVLDITMQLLKDGGIKSKIIKQYLPVINKKVNQYLHAMEFFVNFELDENFNEALKARHLDTFSYANFSEGEKMRIDLALLFTWRAVAKMRNSVHTNLLLLDEIFDSSLDGAGTEEFLKIMMTLIGDTNVFVISHKTDQLADKFERVLRFEKHKGFSRLKE